MNKFYLWSSGLESWEEIILTSYEQEDLIFLYVKNIKEQPGYIFKDKLNRFLLMFENAK